jgi:nucleoside-diphosphate-sugar epimerase
MKKSFLITGCAGFIGSHMTDYVLKRGHKVIGVDNLTSGKKINISHNYKNKNFKFFNLNLRDIDKIKAIKKFDYVLHFAGHGELIPSIENP